MKKNEFTNFVGIDVSKQTLDVVFIINEEVEKMEHRKFTNDPKGIQQIFRYLKDQRNVTKANTLVCFEHTGLYGRKLTDLLFENEWPVWIEMPVAILRSMGLQRGKNDKVDAKRIAVYAMKNKERAKLWEAPRKEVCTLRQLLNARESLIEASKILKVPMQEYKATGNKEMYELIKRSTNSSILKIEKDLEKVEKAIDELIKADQKLRHLFKLLTSIPGIGKITSAELICFTNEFKLYTEARQLACYCGVAPFEHSSGSSVKGRTRVSNMANKKLKVKLHMCAVVASQHNPELKQYYERKVKEGKNKMLILNSLRNKLVHRITAVVKRQTPYELREAA